jgi:hypothetical protein
VSNQNCNKKAVWDLPQHLTVRDFFHLYSFKLLPPSVNVAMTDWLDNKITVFPNLLGELNLDILFTQHVRSDCAKQIAVLQHAYTNSTIFSKDDVNTISSALSDVKTSISTTTLTSTSTSTSQTLPHTTNSPIDVEFPAKTQSPFYRSPYGSLYPHSFTPFQVLCLMCEGQFGIRLAIDRKGLQSKC